MKTFSLAIRNLYRQPVRTSTALAGILFGVVAYVLVGGFIDWIFWAMREGTIYSRLGHIQAMRLGFLESGANDPYAYLLPGKTQELSDMANLPNVQLISPRISFTGLISNGNTSIAYVGEGVDAENEKIISRLLLVSHGESLSSSDPKGIILGEGLATALGVRPGDRIVLMATPAAGGINAIEAHVKGTFYTLSKQFDESALRVPIGLAHELLRTAGAHYWILLLNKTENTSKTVEELRAQFPKSQRQLEFKTWSDMADFYHQTVNLYSRQMIVLQVIIGLMILLSISNIIGMSVLERTGEIGTMLAIGIKKSKVLCLFVLEAFILGAAGGIVGLILGAILAMIISAIGIPMPPAPGMSHGFTGEILLSLPLAFTALAIAMLASTLAGLYPAWRASRLQIVDALRANH